MFFLEYYDMLSGGALGALFVGLVACFMWEHGVPRWASTGPSSTFAPGIERVVAKVRLAVPVSCPASLVVVSPRPPPWLRAHGHVRGGCLGVDPA
jgi:hypothetical protein